jgi:hypothetical protein
LLREVVWEQGAFGFGGLVCRWWFERGGGSRRFLCVASCVGAEFVPVIAVVADKVSDLVKCLVRYDVLERHGVEMRGDSDGGVVLLGLELLYSKIQGSEVSPVSAESEVLVGSSDSDSSVELTGTMVSRRGLPGGRGTARTYSKGRRWWKSRSSVMSEHSWQSCGIQGMGIFTFGGM